MRLAVITTYPPGAGSLNEYAFHFVRFLRTKPELSEVILLTDELPAGELYDMDLGAKANSCAMRVVPCWRFDRVDNAWRILQAVRRTQPDAVLFNIQFASFGGGKVAAFVGLVAPALIRMAGFPTIVLLHNIMETVDLKNAGYAQNPIMERLIRLFGTVVTWLVLRADLVALTIPKYVEILEAKYKANNVVLAPHGSFDETSLPSFDLPPGPMQIMTFGKFGTYKRVESLIEAFKLLQEGDRPPLELVIAGSDSPNAAGYLESMAALYQDVEGLRFTGYVAEEDIARLFGDAAVAVFPYTSTTGSSGVLHQAGSYAKAAVLPRIGDFAEVITEEGYGGEFFEPDNVHSLAAAIGRVIDNPDRRRELGTQNFMASHGLPIGDVVDWYLLHFQLIMAERA